MESTLRSDIKSILNKVDIVTEICKQQAKEIRVCADERRKQKEVLAKIYKFLIDKNASNS